ncbi:carboxylate-amine ligase [Microbaculum marinum]|uniref:Putative glutamate--cysteine ligase 2 n=1 Tax=Microbaculum marinum TaxID=1764581 RepID=A0AAW9RLW0_9HYPH
MSRTEPSFTVGIEEEYLLVDRVTRDLAADPPPELMERCEAALPKRVAPEFLRCQIEVGTSVCSSLEDARSELAHLRGTIAGVASDFGLAPIAASTHPFANWASQQHTDRDRYNALARDIQMVIRRMLICGMHVHVAIDDDALRIDLFNQLSYFLPHLLALTTSSPFWQGHETGLKSYRLSVFNEMPRTGLPEAFSSEDEYRRTIDVLVHAGVIEDGTKVWWDLRPSARFPTLEMRIADVCTRLDDAIAVAAIFRCLARMLWRLRRENQRWRHYSRFLIEENRWLAQRHGASGGMIDFGKSRTVPYSELLEEILDLIREDAAHFGCLAAVEHARAIVSEGTSADRQVATYKNSIAEGHDPAQALQHVVDRLIEETVEGIPDDHAPPVAAQAE